MRTLTITILFILSLWQLGQGGYIYAKAQVAQWLMADAWQQTLAGVSDVKPWDWADTWPVARLKVPAHDIDVLVLQGSSGRTLAFGPGHMANTPLPGEGGNSVIGGHRDTHFRFLQNVKVGDILEVETADNQQLRYQVFARSIVDHNDTEQVLNQQGSEELTLVTCYPFDAIAAGGPLRFVVEARRLSENGSSTEENPDLAIFRAFSS
ncbi:MAG: class GN sortase [Algicola sp.]|nr:class GN sortase [Algicola sp.]